MMEGSLICVKCGMRWHLNDGNPPEGHAWREARRARERERR